MIKQTIQLFTDKEEEFVNLLIQIGMKKNVANMLVFLTNTEEATSRDIERGTDLRQPEVSLAIKYLAEQGWIKSKEIASDRKGRPVKNYTLAKPVTEIMTSIEKQKKAEANNQLALVKKMRNFI
ncbi:MAG: MarR family transcriptional regulator [Methanoregula sp.]|jgi:predicted transcriptional regulator